MRHRSLIAGFIALALLAHGQVTKAVYQTWTPPRMADGHPDLGGYWANNNATPLERPAALAGRERLTDAELRAMKQKYQELFNGNGDAAFGDDVFNTVLTNVLGSKNGFKSADGETGDYSSAWTVQRVWDNRTSLITNPADGRLPAPSEEGLARRRAQAARSRGIYGPEDRSLSERCITYGSPPIIAGYQSYYQIVQSPKSLALITEMIHDTRVIPFDGGPHVPSKIQLWHGDSRGHWEGDTLVVDTANYREGAFFRGASSAKLHVTEHFTLSGPNTIQYEITIDDPGTWSKPWKAMIPWQRAENQVFEYACHEGNLGLAGILTGARAEERDNNKADGHR
jgi:hypothetical protein